MDIRQSTSVTYRAVELNDAATTGPNTKITGTLVTDVQWLGVAGVGYTEKRAQADGNDSADVWEGPRRVRIAATSYGVDAAEVFDRVRAIRALFSPTLAYNDAPDDRGYNPLTFSEPTKDVANWGPDIDMVVYARPIAQPDILISRDRIGGADRGGAISWSVVLECRDPLVYGAEVQIESFTDDGSATLYNRGNYPAPCDVVLGSPAGTEAIDVTVTGLNCLFTISTELNGDADQIYTYEARTGLLMVDVGGVVSLRMDLLTNTAEQDVLLIPPGNDGGDVAWTTTGEDTIDGSFRWNDAFA